MKELFLSLVVLTFAFASRANPVEMEFPKFSKKVTERGKDKNDVGCEETYDKLRNEGERNCSIVDLIKGKTNHEKRKVVEQKSDEMRSGIK